MNKQDIDDLKTGVERAFKAAIFSMDYWILRIILDSSKALKSAYRKHDYQTMNCLVNKAFWDIGVCINNKITNYGSVMPEFFDNISSNIKFHFKVDKTISYSPENLKRCLKLVNIAKESWFEEIARKFTWQYIADAIDHSNSLDELKPFLGIERAKLGEPVALRLCVERLLPQVKPDTGIRFELPEGRIDAGDNMLQIVNDITQAVASGDLTIDEAEKFNEFLKYQRWHLKEAEREIESEIRDAEWKKRWENKSIAE